MRISRFNQLMDQFMPQQLLAVLACPVVGLLLTILLRLLGVFGSATAGISGIVLTAPIVVSGFVFGYLLPPLASRGPELARWTGVAPSVVLIIICISDARVLGIREMLSSYFNIVHPTELGIGLIFVTLPTWSAITYALGSAIYLRRQKRVHRDDWNC